MRLKILRKSKVDHRERKTSVQIGGGSVGDVRVNSSDVRKVARKKVELTRNLVESSNSFAIQAIYIDRSENVRSKVDTYLKLIKFQETHDLY